MGRGRTARTHVGRGRSDRDAPGRRGLAHVGGEIGERLERTPLVEPFLPDQRLFRDRAEGRLSPHFGDPDGTHRDAVHRHVPVVARREVRHIERRRPIVLALNGVPECARKRASPRPLGLGGGRLGRGEARRQRARLRRRSGRRLGRSGLRRGGRMARRPARTRGGGSGGRVPNRARLRHFGAELDEVPALAALHADGLPGDLLVRDLVLRLALFAEELQRRPLPELTVPDGQVSKEGRAGARGSGSPQISCRRCSLTDARVASSGASAAHRSHISTALFRKPAFS